MNNTRSWDAGFSESAEGLVVYADHLPLGMRLFGGAIGASMFVIPVPFFMHAHSGLPWYQLLLAAACVLLPSLLGLFFLMLSLSRPLRLQFDTPRRSLLVTSRWPLGKRAVPVDYRHITALGLQQRESEDGPYFVVRLALNGKRPWHLGSFGNRADAEHWLGRMEAQRTP